MADESNAKLLEELVAFNQSLNQPPPSTSRRTASLVLPRSSIPSNEDASTEKEGRHRTKPRSRRMSLSPGHSRSKLRDDVQSNQAMVADPKHVKMFDEKAGSTGKKGLWNWKPIRAISHLRKQKLGCLFSVQVVGVQGLPASMDGLRLAVCVRKKETKEGAVQTMPSRVSDGDADFEETLFARCHVYCSSSPGKQLKFEPRPFLIYVLAIDAKELDFGMGSVDLSHLIRESIERSVEGARVRQWEIVLNLTGKATGGELVLKLGFQIMEKDGGPDIYSQALGLRSTAPAPSSARKQSKSSFSIPSPGPQSRTRAWDPPQAGATARDLPGIDELNLDEPAPTAQKPGAAPPSQTEDLDLPEFEVVDKGVEFQDQTPGGGQGGREESVEEKSALTEDAGAVLHDPIHLTRLTELHSIAEQIKALESMMREEGNVQMDGEQLDFQRLEADEETVTMEFLQMLEEDEMVSEPLHDLQDMCLKNCGEEDSAEPESKAFLPDLARNLGCVVQTRDGGYLVSMNPQDMTVERKDAPKLAMQISKPAVLPMKEDLSGLELIQMMTAIGSDELGRKIPSLMVMDDLMGKTAEQIAFEGIASAIIHGRNKEGASSSAARTIATVKTLATAANMDRGKRISSGIWSANEDPLKADEILAFSLQKIEAVAVEALKIQADMAEEDAPFDVSSFYGNRVRGEEEETKHPLDSAVALEDWIANDESSSWMEGESSDPVKSVTLWVVVQLRDPTRRYEAVGSPMIALIQAVHCRVETRKTDNDDDEGGRKFKVTGLHIGGLSGGRGGAWDTDKQRLTAMQWLVAHGLGKVGRREKQMRSKSVGVFWSISSRVMADMWLKPIRNPDVKFSG